MKLLPWLDYQREPGEPLAATAILAEVVEYLGSKNLSREAFDALGKAENETASSDAVPAAESASSSSNGKQVSSEDIIDEQLSVCESCEQSAEHAHGVAVLTEWDVFRDGDYDKVLNGMYKPAFLFDGRNILDHQRLSDLGFDVYAIGKG